MTLLQTQDGDVLTTKNNLVNYSYLTLGHIAVQVLYTAIKSNLSPHKHRYLIYYIRALLWILKFGYPASNIVITSSLSYCALLLFVTPLSSKSLTTYGHPITVLDSSVGTTKNTNNGYIDIFLLRTLAHGRAINTAQTHQHASPG